ncbi:ATP phosphoribosyltransferase regulatory subunit [Aestuariispira insulae]|uniref:ATP phosphoribosyltransferase regulatory subunit n=1 Tax=Aestuariispira insulae TaxID=1461337 RepID=A0A3D9HW76_9PROT|nr:ATP phosphoribosyltransferase regulatory subunit [Aestuariispira insulae]RED53641.1 ATP phosphoribosyltransferase regulatory subunit [Aestuariispira insulae]
MNSGVKKSLLPQGLRDLLPPEAIHEASVMDGLLEAFSIHGYERVEPPLVEFEENLLDGAGEAMAPHTFRLMDPVSQRMMGVRADMTPQVARIATSRLAAMERPLRLFYGGQVLRVKGSQLRPERQVAQAGVELIGADSPEADAEVIALAYEALQTLGVENLSVDISLPTIVRAICDDLGLDRDAKEDVRSALDRKDAAAIAAMAGPVAGIFGGLLQASGLADKAIAALNELTLPEAAAAERDRLILVVERLSDMALGLMVTVDPVEHRGFEYQTGLSFTLFDRDVRGELGRGGRYLAGAADEAATGFSLYMDTVLRAVPKRERRSRLYLPHGTDLDIARRERTAGWITVSGLAPEKDVLTEAARLRCSHVLTLDGIVAVEKE